MNSKPEFTRFLGAELIRLKKEGLFKSERVLSSPQQALIEANGKKVINLCSNNYLGLANDPRLIKAAHEALTRFGFGLSSVRFICGTQTIHKELENSLSEFLQMEDTILYSSCFDANGGVFEALFDERDAIISDSLNHASIIDGVRLSKAKRFRYENNDMGDLEAKLKATHESPGLRFRVIVTDGVFSMDGIIANLKAICDLSDKYDALVMVDDSHAVGFVGEKGGGTPEFCGVLGRVDILTGTLGKALGGAAGGYVSARTEVVGWLRQRSRPYLFSNTLAPVIAATSIEALRVVQMSKDLRAIVSFNSSYFREQMGKCGFTLAGKGHPIIPVMLGDAKVAVEMSQALFEEGVYVVGFSFPVVPAGQARIRTQMSAAHLKSDLDQAISAFEKVGRQMGVI